jgi:hypothetical protein
LQIMLSKINNSITPIIHKTKMIILYLLFLNYFVFCLQEGFFSHFSA